MKKWKTKRGVEVFQVLNGRSNAYLIVSENGNVLVDTGKVSVFKRLQKNIATLKLPKKTIDLLILTHTHFDHCQNANVIKEQYHCIIMVSEYEAGFSQQGYTPLPKGTFAITQIISKLGIRMGGKQFGFKPFFPDVLINKELDLENYGLKLTSTPGHSSGSISVIVDNEIAIVGDALFGVFRNSVLPPFADNIPEMVKSWGHLLETNCNCFLPGHGNEITRELLQVEFDKLCRKFNSCKNQL